MIATLSTTPTRCQPILVSKNRAAARRKSSILFLETARPRGLLR